MFGSLRKAYLRKKLGPPIVVVSGLPRSGTSMMMKMLTAAGLEIVTDNIRVADEDNPKGYFEFEKVKELDKDGDKSWLVEHKGRVLKVISFLLKDLPDDYYYKVIFMRRDLDEVIASQNKMLVRRGEEAKGTQDDRMIQLYRGHLRKVDVMMEHRPNFERLDVSHRDVIDQPQEQAERIAGFLGLRADPGDLAAAVDRKLYRNRRRA